jgi:hypothetical protein
MQRALELAGAGDQAQTARASAVTAIDDAVAFAADSPLAIPDGEA